MQYKKEKKKYTNICIYLQECIFHFKISILIVIKKIVEENLTMVKVVRFYGEFLAEISPQREIG